MRARTLLAFVVALVVAVGVVSAAPATLGPELPGTVEAGSSVTGDLVVSDVTDPQGVGSFTVNVTYDPSLVSVSAREAGSTFDVETDTPEPGVLRIVGYTGQYPGPNGTVALAELVVTGESAGDATLSVEVESVTDADGDEIPVSTASDTVTVERSSSGGGSSSTSGSSGGGGGSVGGSTTATPIGTAAPSRTPTPTGTRTPGATPGVSSTSTPTQTPTPTVASAGSGTPTQTGTPSPTATRIPETSGGASTEPPTATETSGSGPGFGPAASLVALGLLLGALLSRSRSP